MALKVLVVDDSPAVRLTLRSGLVRIGVDRSRVFEAEDAATAMRLFRKVHPEVVFMDLSLKPRVETGEPPKREPDAVPTPTEPVEQGEVLAKQMLYQDPSVKVVICTGVPADSASVQEVVKYGAFCVLQKPVTLQQIHRVFQVLAAEGLMLSESGPFNERRERPSGETPTRPRPTWEDENP